METVRDLLKSNWTTFVLAILAVVGLFGWWSSLRPAAPVWGPVSEWVGGLATAAGLMFTAKQIRDATRERRATENRRIEEEDLHREAQARSVAIWSVVDRSQSGRLTRWTKPKWSVKYTLSNGGDYPIDNVVVCIGDPGSDDYAPWEQRGTAIEQVIGTVLPKQEINETLELSFRIAPHFGEMTSLGYVLFTDSWNQPWSRGPGHLVRRSATARSC